MKNSSDSGSYGEYDDNSSEKSGDSNSEAQAYDASEDESDMLEEPGFTRMTSMQIGSEYTPIIISNDRLFSLLQNKMVEVRDRFEYVNLDQGLALEYLRKNYFLVEDTCQKLQEKVLSIMDSQQDNNEGQMEEEDGMVMCQIDYMPVEKHKARHLGCNHVVCDECWFDYIKQKVKEGMDCIHAKCPVSGCNRHLTIDIVEEISDKETSKMYFYTKPFFRIN